MSLPEMLARLLAAHKITATVETVIPGPRLTRANVVLAPGVPLQRLTRIERELALALRVPSLRIQPVPAEGVVAIEIPNPSPVEIPLTDLIQQHPAKDLFLPLYLGVTGTGTPLVADLVTLPHLLIAGTTGSGKSIALHAILGGLTLHRSPEQVRLLLIDPKQVELMPYADLPHLTAEVVTTPSAAEDVLGSLVQAMEVRYSHLQRYGVSDLAEAPGLFPRIVVVIDELADLMLDPTHGRMIEIHLVRLAQKARAAGIHLVAATQRPQARVVTGLIKANFPARLAFRVASRLDSRVILDLPGAETLLGAGDFLYHAPGMGEPIRGQGAYMPPALRGALVRHLLDKYASRIR